MPSALLPTNSLPERHRKAIIFTRQSRSYVLHHAVVAAGLPDCVRPYQTCIWLKYTEVYLSLYSTFLQILYLAPQHPSFFGSYLYYSVSTSVNSGARPYDDAGLGLSGIGELQRLGPILFAVDCHGLPQELQLPYGLPWVKTCKHNTDTKHMTSLCIWVAKHLITGGIDSAHIMLEFARLVRYKYDAMKLQPWCSTDSLTSKYIKHIKYPWLFALIDEYRSHSQRRSKVQTTMTMGLKLVSIDSWSCIAYYCHCVVSALNKHPRPR